MSSPSITATISAVDQASAIIQNFARNAKTMADQLNKVATSAGVASGKTNGALNDMARNTSRVAGKIHADSLGIAASFGIMAGGATAALRKIVEISKEISTLTSKMKAYGGASEKAVQNILTTGSSTDVRGYQGGMTGYTRAAYAATRANLSPEAAEVAAKHGVKFGDLINTESGDATEKLLQYGNMTNAFRDKDGKAVTADKLTVKELDRQLADLRGRYIQLARRMPGKESDIFEYTKMAGPAATAMNMDKDTFNAFMLLQANKGISGSQGGVYMRRIAQSGIPTAKGVQAAVGLGLDPAKYMEINTEPMEADNINKALESKFGKLNDATKKGVKTAVDRFKAGETDAVAYSKELSEAVGHSGKKSLQDRERAMKAVYESMLPFVTGYNATQEFGDAAKKGAGPGYMRARFGIEAATGALAIVVQDFKGTIDALRKERESTSGAKVAQDADVKRQDSFGFQWERFTNGLTAMTQRLFGPWENVAKTVLQGLNFFIDAVNSSSDAVRKFAGATVAAATVMGAIKGAGVVKDTVRGVVGGGVGSTVAGAATGATVGGIVRAGIKGAVRTVGRAGVVGAGMWIADEIIEGAIDSLYSNPLLNDADTEAKQKKLAQLRKQIKGAPADATGMGAVTVKRWQAEAEKLEGELSNRRQAETRGQFNENMKPRAWPGTDARDWSIPGPRTPAGEYGAPASQQSNVTVAGEASITNEIVVRPEATQMFWLEVERKIGQSAMTLRDKMGTSNGGTNGTSQPLPFPNP